MAGSTQDRHGVVAWALARLAGPAASPRIAELLQSQSPVPADGWTRLAVLARTAGEHRVTAARQDLERLAARADAPAHVKSCALEALSWIAGASVPHTFLLPPHAAFVHTGLRWRQGQTGSIAARELSDLPERRPPERDTHAVADLGVRTVGLPDRPTCFVADVDTELILRSYDTGLWPNASTHATVVLFTVSR